MSDTTNRDGRVGDDDGVQPTASAEDASTSVQDHDAHQPLVDDGDAPTQQMPVQGDAPRDEADDWQRSWDEAGGGDIEPTVIAPSALRGPSHEHEHDAEHSSLEQPPADGETHERDAAHADPATADAVRSSRSVEAGEHPEPTDPPELVEPRRPSLSLRGEQRPDLADTAPFEGLGGAGVAAGAGATAGAAAAAASRRDEPAPTEAMPVQRDERTQAMPAATATEPQFEVDEPVEEQRTERRDAERDERTERLGSIPVDDATARAAATGTPIVLVESATPPRKKGARGVGFLVVLLSTIVFGALLAAAFLAVDFLFDRDFVLQDAVQGLWLSPSWLLPVAVFLVAYWLTTIIVNRAGWWAHVLGGFIVALLAYGAHVAGAYLETQSNVWDVTALTGIGARDLGRLLLAPTAIVTFLLAREVPIWFGGIVARRGRRVKQRNREALAEYEAEQARRLEEYEATRA